MFLTKTVKKEVMACGVELEFTALDYHFSARSVSAPYFATT